MDRNRLFFPDGQHSSREPIDNQLVFHIGNPSRQGSSNRRSIEKLRKGGREMLYPNDANGDVLRRMEAQGDDLTLLRDIDFTVVFAKERSARGFAKHFHELGFATSIEATGVAEDSHGK
jgi:hypothetical protein